MGKKFLLLFSAVCWGAFYTYADECLCNECKCAQKQRSSGMGGSGNRQRGFGMGGSGNRQRGFGMGGGGNRQRGFGMGGGNFRKPKPAEPSQELVNDSNLRRLEFTSSNGTVKYCEFLENPDAPGKMHLVLLLHGLSNSGNDNLRQLAMPAIKPLLDFLRKNKIKATTTPP